jgi:hypothetical protein
MTNHKLLKNIAGGICGSFVSRNNDSAGYWAIGKLYSLASSMGVDSLRINIKPLDDGTQEPLLDFVAARYAAMLNRLISSSRVQPTIVTSVYIDVQFDVEDSNSTFIYWGVGGSRVLCKAVLVDRYGKEHFQIRRTTCDAHDPSRERRSVRRDGV